jgi:hypothetical protein
VEPYFIAILLRKTSATENFRNNCGNKVAVMIYHRNKKNNPCQDKKNLAGRRHPFQIIPFAALYKKQLPLYDEVLQIDLETKGNGNGRTLYHQGNCQIFKYQ